MMRALLPALLLAAAQGSREDSEVLFKVASGQKTGRCLAVFHTKFGFTGSTHLAALPEAGRCYNERELFRTRKQRLASGFFWADAGCRLRIWHFRECTSGFGEFGDDTFFNMDARERTEPLTWIISDIGRHRLLPVRGTPYFGSARCECGGGGDEEEDAEEDEDEETDMGGAALEDEDEETDMGGAASEEQVEETDLGGAASEDEDEETDMGGATSVETDMGGAASSQQTDIGGAASEDEDEETDMGGAASEDEDEESDLGGAEEEDEAAQEEGAMSFGDGQASEEDKGPVELDEPAEAPVSLASEASGLSHRRRAFFRRGHAACSYFWQRNHWYSPHWYGQLDEDECQTLRKGSQRLQSWGYAFVEDGCRLEFYSKRRCRGGRRNSWYFAPGGRPIVSGVARLDRDFGAWKDKIVSVKCRCW